MILGWLWLFRPKHLEWLILPSACQQVCLLANDEKGKWKCSLKITSILQIFSSTYSTAILNFICLTLVFQQLLGFEFVDYDNALKDVVLDDHEKEFIYKVCFMDKQTEDHATNEKDSLSILTLVTLQEAKMQAEIIYALHAVTQFMNWWELSLLVLAIWWNKIWNGYFINFR
jgi:hypothetical protein